MKWQHGQPVHRTEPRFISSCGFVYIGYRPTYVVHTHLYILYVHPLTTGQQLHLPDVFQRNKPRLPRQLLLLWSSLIPIMQHA